VLLHAVPEVLRAFPDAKFALVGRGWGPEGPAYQRQLENLAQSLGVAGSVLFPGERGDGPDTLASFDISVHPSLNDNLGGTVESLLMARPMVVSDIRGYNDTVIHEETGLVVPAGDAPALAAAIVRLLGDRQFARRLGENGRRRMLGRFTLAHTVADIEALIAADGGRAETHYRPFTMLRRLLAAPFRLLPAVLKVRRVIRRYSRTSRSERFSVLAKHHLREAVKRTPARSSSPGRVRIAQVAGVWSRSDWFVALCRDLAARGYDVVAVIDARRGDLAERLTEAGIRHHTLALTFGTRFDQGRVAAYAFSIPLAAMKLARILRAERIDLVHSHIFATVVVARLAAVLAGVRHVAGITGPRHLEAPLTRRIDRLTWWLDDATVAGCRHTQELYRALGANPDRLQCIYYGVDAGRFDPVRSDGAEVRRALGVAAAAPIIGLVAQFYPPTCGAQTPRHTAGRGL
jgi:glycosyltransferase involved in cell wall biosynthesis